MNIRQTVLTLFLFLALSLAGPAHAHRVSIFAYVEGDTIYSESYFNKKKKVHQGKIEVFNLQNGNLLLQGKTDDEGNFNFGIPEAIKKEKAGLKLVLHASEGHRNEWQLPYSEIFPDMPSSELPAPEPQQVASKPSSESITAQLSPTELSSLRLQIKELNSKMDTLKRLLIDQQEKGPGVQEIFAGIGYILGLFGIAAFFTSRKK